MTKIQKELDIQIKKTQSSEEEQENLNEVLVLDYLIKSILEEIGP